MEPSGVSVNGPAAVIVLAAGEGTRMKSSTPKVLHEVCGRTMLGHALAAARELAPRQLAVVVGEADGPVARYLADYWPDARAIVQGPRRGTGHAVRVAVEALAARGGPGLDGTVVVTYGDTPLLRGQTLRDLVGAHEAAGAAVTALVARASDPTGYGRIVRDAAGRFTAIVEHADATPEQAAITEINSGMYAFDGIPLAAVLKRLTTGNAKGEEYLTEALTILSDDGLDVGTVWCADFDEILAAGGAVLVAVDVAEILFQGLQHGMRERCPQRLFGGALSQYIDAAPHAFCLSVRQRFVLAGEVVVEGADRDAGQVRDVVARHVVQPAFERELQRGIAERTPGVGLLALA